MIEIFFLENFKDYYNRQGFKYDTLREYGDYVMQYMEDVNFNPNDGVITSFVANIGVLKSSPDYVLVVENGTEILSRWYVLESHYDEGGQCTLTLYRDLVADNLDNILDAPCYIEKATIRDPSDPAMLNKENLQLNQIKTEETLLKDKTKVSWIVGFLDNNRTVEQKTVTIPPQTVFRTFPTLPATDYKVCDLDNFIRGGASTPVADYGKGLSFAHSMMITPAPIAPTPSYLFEFNGTTPYEYRSYITPPFENQAEAFQYYYDHIKPNLQGIIDYVKGQEGLTSIQLWEGYYKPMVGKVVYVQSTNKYYSVSLQSEIGIDGYSYHTEGTSTLSPKTEFSSQMDYLFNDKDEGYPFRSTENDYYVGYTTYSLKFTEISNVAGLTDIPVVTDRQNLEDAPYSMFCFPAEDYQIRESSTSPTINISGGQMTLLGSKIAEALGDHCYDVQRLPYCPLNIGEDILIDEDTGYITSILSEPSSGKWTYIYNDDGETVSGYVFWCSRSSGELSIDYSIEVLDPKVENETDMYRLCAPDYSSAFEFSPAMNGGVSLFNVDWQYKPNQSYIHINPNFNYLYGRDFNDTRGLTITTDRSLPHVQSAWVTYQNNNSTYQLAFDREIANLEFNQKQERIKSYLGVAEGALRGAVGGASGGVQGAVIGAVKGSAGSIIDTAMLIDRQAEVLDYKRDMYSYSLRNIQAQPNTLAKVSPFSPNDKIFPTLEYYTCTEIEKQALRDKLKYNGMTIMRVGKLRDYVDEEESYVKGRIIRLEGISDDYHTANSIAEEIAKGVFLKVKKESEVN